MEKIKTIKRKKERKQASKQASKQEKEGNKPTNPGTALQPILPVGDLKQVTELKSILLVDGMYPEC